MDKMINMKILDGFVALIEIAFSKAEKKPAYTPERINALMDCLEELDDLRAQLQLEDIKDEQD